MRRRRSLRRFFHPVAAFIEENRNHPMLGKIVEGYEKAFGALQLATAHIATKGLSDPEEAGASEYLRSILAGSGFRCSTNTARLCTDWA
jgi:hypothetical protein